MNYTLKIVIKGMIKMNKPKEKETKQAKDKKSYKVSKDSKYKIAKGIPFVVVGAITLTLGIGIVKYNTNKTRKEAIEKETFENVLDKVADNTCLDELLDENILNNISIIERQLKASNDIQNLNLEKYDIVSAYII